MGMHIGFAVHDHLVGSSFSDIILGLGGDDTLSGEGGNDFIDGGAGDDTMSGGTGNDTFVVDSLLDHVFETAGQGTDTVLVSLSTYTIGDDVEVMYYTGSGNFIGFGNSLKNVLYGDIGDDELHGMAGSDALLGYDGDDTLDGGNGSDEMVGGRGDDFYVVNSIGDIVFEEFDEGTDTIATTLKTLVLPSDVEKLLYQGTSNFTGTGNDLDNEITGGDGNDTLDGGLGKDAMVGGLGNDTYKVDSIDDIVIEIADQGTDRIVTTLATFTLGATLENLSYAGASDFTGIGNGSINTIIGGNGDDTLSGLGGNDRLIGGSGNDELDGGLGNDTLVGGVGDDTYFVGLSSDLIIERLDEGTDEVVTTRSSLELAANVENLTHTGSSSFTGTGNELDNVIRGGSGTDTLFGAGGDDTLDGGGGSDTMSGGAGDDTYIVGSVGDVVTETADEGDDTVVTTLATLTLADEVETLIYGGTSNFTGTGNGLANVIIGGVGNDTLDGGAGDDTMSGGTGNDLYRVDSAGDVATELSGEGIDTIETTTASFTLPTHFEHLVYVGGGDFTGIGNWRANVIDGGVGDDRLTGLGAADVLRGGAGQDVFVYTALSDSRGTGIDTIRDFSQAEGDKIDLSAIDADSGTAGVQAFTFIATSNFSGTSGELRYSSNGTDTTVEADTNGDSVADLTIRLTGDIALADNDFIGATGGMASFGGHYYKAVINPTPLSWLEAAAQAEAMGGHLVTITSAEENDFVFSLVNSPEYWSPNGNHGSWIGGYQPAGSAEPDGGWRWVTDEAFSYAPWSPTEPNNADGNENVLHFHFPNGGVPIWNDYAYDQAAMPGVLLVSSYIVEFDGLTSHIPTVTDLTGV